MGAIALRALALLWKPIAAILAVLGIYAAGAAQARQKAKSKGLQDYSDTRKRIDDAEIPSDDPAVLRDWLRERGKRGDL